MTPITPIEAHCLNKTVNPTQVVASNRMLPNGAIYVMTLMRSTASINKAENAGRMDAQIMSAKALQWVFPTTVASYLTFHGSVRQEATGNR